MDRTKLLQSLSEEIRRVFKGMISSHSLRFGDLKLSKLQIIILINVAREKEGITVKDLAQNLSVTSGAITQFIDELIGKKLVVREEVPNDRRSLKIKLSSVAESRMKEFKKDYFTSLAPMFDSLNNDEISQLTNLLSKINVLATKKEQKK